MRGMHAIMSQPAADVFRRNVRRVMDERGINITELAEKIGTSRPAMSRILSGIDGVTIDRAERIAKALKQRLADLFLEKSDYLATAS